MSAPQGRMVRISTTCGGMEDARALARAALDARLAACANITPGLVSLFHWQGALEEDTETAITFKTTEDLRAALVELIVQHHPYDLPVITWETVGATEAAAEWCQEEASSSTG